MKFLLFGLLAGCVSSAQPEDVRMELQLGHADSILAGAFSRNGTLALTASNGVATLWDLQTQMEIRQFHGTWSGKVAAAFAGENRVSIAAADGRSGALYRLDNGEPISGGADQLDSCSDGELILRAVSPVRGSILDATSGRVLAEVPLAPDAPGHLSCSADHRLAMIPAMGRGQLREAQIWDLTTRSQVRTLSDPARGIATFAISPDGRLAATADARDATIHLWDVQTGREPRALTGHRDLTRKQGTNQNGTPIRCLVFSPDSKWVASGGMDTAAIVWDASTGAVVSRIGNVAAVSTVAFSPDGSRILLGLDNGDVRIVDVVERVVPKLIAAAKIAAERHEDAPNQSELLSLKSVPETRAVVQRANLNTALERGRTGYLSPDGRFLFTIWESESVDLNSFAMPAAVPLAYWDLQTGRSGRWAELPCVFNIAFTPNSKWMALGHIDGSVSLWDLPGHRLVRNFPGVVSPVTALALSPDAKWFLVGHRDGLLQRVSAGDGAAVAMTLPDHFWPDDSEINSDGRHALVGLTTSAASGAAMVQIFDAAQPGSRTFQIPAQFGPRGMAAFTADGRSVLLSDGAGVAIYDMGSLEKRIELKGAGPVRRLAVSPDGRRVLLASLRGGLALWDLASQITVWQTPPRGNGDIKSIQFLPDGKHVFASQSDGTSRFLAAADGSTYATLALRGYDNLFPRIQHPERLDQSWVVVAPDGRFDCDRFENPVESESGFPFHWISSAAPLVPLPMELFIRAYYEPRLLTRLLAGEKFPPVRSLGELNLVRPTVSLTGFALDPDFPDQITIHVEVTATVDGKTGRSSGARNLRLLRDGRLIASAPDGNGDIPLIDGKASFDLHHIRAPGGRSYDFSVYLFNSDGVKTATVHYLYIKGGTLRLMHSALPARPPAKLPADGRRAWILNIGVNASAAPGLNLRYSANDARRLGSDLKQLLDHSGQFEEVIQTALVSDEQHRDGASKEAIRDAFESLTVTGRRPAQINDLVMVSFSGHGYADHGGKFYLIPSDAGKDITDADPNPSAMDRLLAESISSDNLSRWLRNIDARDIVLIVDACQSAAIVGGSGFKPGPMGNPGLGQLAYDKGLMILAATQADNVALETGQVAQGLLTYALTHDAVERKAADTNPKDGRIDLREWLRYGADRVPDLWSALEAGKLEQLAGTRALVPQGTSMWHDRLRQEPALFDFASGEARRQEVVITMVDGSRVPGVEAIKPAEVLAGGITAPVALFRKQLDYTQEAVKAGVDGAIKLSIEVDPRGMPRNIRLVQGVGLGLDEKAMEAARLWEFRPGQKEGKAVSVNEEISFRIRIPPGGNRERK